MLISRLTAPYMGSNYSKPTFSLVGKMRDSSCSRMRQLANGQRSNCRLLEPLCFYLPFCPLEGAVPALMDQFERDVLRRWIPCTFADRVEVVRALAERMSSWC